MSIKSWFVKEDEPKQETDKKPEQPRQPAVSPAPIPQVGSTVGSTDYTVYMDKVMEAANIPGPDYFEFAKALAKKAGQPITEQQMYQYTFEAFSTMNVTAGQLVETAGKYLNVLKHEAADFKQEMENARKTQVLDKQAVIRENEEKMRKLQEETAALNAQVNTSVQKLAVEEAASNNALYIRTQLIQEHISKINQHLNNANA